VDDTTGVKLRALVAALARARQPGDRFSITVAGHPGGLLVAPEEFRYGTIRVAMQSLFTTPSDTRAPAMDLAAAVHAASRSVRQGDDPSAPLGASLVLLVSTAPFAEQRESLERMAHENAVAGIGMSVVAVGGGADLVSMDRLALLGQGHRRVLAAAEDAVKLVDRELHAASRAVARAVRLRIRLAPGVELIDVLGSKNLSDQAAQRVREAERSIDQRMARNIGIRADRGEDEEGIQIVIPSFFATAARTKKAFRSSSRASSPATAMRCCWMWWSRDRARWPTSACVTRISFTGATVSPARGSPWRMVCAMPGLWNAMFSRISWPTRSPVPPQPQANSSPPVIAAPPFAR
jgi:hypothetical protein